MGCASSKQTRANAPVVVYRPPPSSFAVFDINSIEEPWLKLDNVVTIDDTQKQKPSLLPPPLLEKLDTLDKDDGPRSWDEVSKALEDLKKQPNPTPTPSPSPNPNPGPNPTPLKKNQSFHTLDELESKKQAEKKDDDETSKNQLMGIRLRKTASFPDDSTQLESPAPGPGQAGFKSVKANPFILRDRMEREKEGKEAAFDKIMKAKRDPLGDFPELCPPGGAYLVVLYTTSLGGVRRTFEDCNRVRAILETHRVVFDERDVSLHGEFLSELKELVGSGSGSSVPKLFVKGRCLGGAEEVVELNESGQFGRILSWARVERGPGWQGCEGCGGARFIPCLECGGSCKVVVEDTKERCSKCNENGLVHCPRCH